MRELKFYVVEKLTRPGGAWEAVAGAPRALDCRYEIRQRGQWEGNPQWRYRVRRYVPDTRRAKR